MQIGIINYYEIYNINNALFNPSTYPIGEDLGYPFVHLKNVLESRGFRIDTLDMHPISTYDKIVYLDFPNNRISELEQFYANGKELYLIILESEIIKPDNFAKENHFYFKKVFTWNDDLVDNIRYFKLNLANKIPSGFRIDINKKDKFCTMIAGNKKNLDSRELYSERLKAINWFEKNHPNMFDLYGFNWDKSKLTFPYSKFNKHKLFRKLFSKSYQVYKGKVERKKDTLERYKFSICYENAKDINGYITEKIFDCFFAGVIPVYLGPSNISDIIPKDTFIDMRTFSDYSQLFDFLNDMTMSQYLDYVDSIERFVNGNEIDPFSASNFSSVLVKELF